MGNDREKQRADRSDLSHCCSVLPILEAIFRLLPEVDGLLTHTVLQRVTTGVRGVPYCQTEVKKL